MITNADITIYNRISVPPNQDEWRHTVVKNVSFYSDTKVNLDSNGLSTANMYKIRIPQESCKGYVPPDQYTGAEGTWTIQNDDYIVRGISELNISRPVELKHGIRINSWSDNRRGTLRHLRIGGQ